MASKFFLDFTFDISPTLDFTAPAFCAVKSLEKWYKERGEVWGREGGY